MIFFFKKKALGPSTSLACGTLHNKWGEGTGQGGQSLGLSPAEMEGGHRMLLLLIRQGRLPRAMEQALPHLHPPGVPSPHQGHPTVPSQAALTPRKSLVLWISSESAQRSKASGGAWRVSDTWPVPLSALATRQSHHYLQCQGQLKHQTLETSERDITPPQC